MAKLGIGYLTSYRYSAHPFSPDTQALAYPPEMSVVGASAMLPADFMLDAYVLLGPDDDTLRLSRVDWDAEAAVFTFTFVAMPGGAIHWIDVPDIPVIEAAMVRGGYYLMSASFAGGQNQYVLRAVCDHGFVEYLARIKDGGYASFDARGGVWFSDEVIERAPPKPLSLALYRGDMSPVEGDRVSGDVQLIPGHNIAMDLVAGTAADTSEVTLHAVPGAGDGRAPCQHSHDAGPAIKPDATGDIRLEGDACYAIVPNASLGQIMIHGSCYACCSCDDYVAVGRAVATLIDGTHTVRLLLDSTHDLYNQQVADYGARHFPAVRKGYLTLQALAGFKDEDPKLGGASGHGHATVSLSNRGEGPLTGTVSVHCSAVCMGGVIKIGAGPATQAGLTASFTVPEGQTMTLSYRFKSRSGALGPVSAVANYQVGGRAYSASLSTPFGRPN